MCVENACNKIARGFVLAGGGSTRFGRDKALVEIEGVPMLLRMRALLEGVTSEVKVVADPSKYSALGIIGVPDRWERQGPLAGIISALLSSDEAGHATWNLILGCDMPFLTREWLAYLAGRAQASNAEVIAPQSARGFEPLCACWRTSAASRLQEVFDGGTRRVSEAMKLLRMEIVDEADWKRFGASGQLFWNMNTPTEYEEAKRIFEAQRA